MRPQGPAVGQRAQKTAACPGTITAETIGHDLNEARRELLRRKVNFPPEIVEQLVRVNTWSVTLRYEPGRIKLEDAKAVVSAASQILKWVQSKL
jgi:HEPN domain-containing protein